MSFLQKVLDEINFVRKNPSAFADKLLTFKNYFKGKIIKFPGQKVGNQTEEGFPAYEEAAKYLKTLKPTEEMIASKGLCKIAQDFLDANSDKSIEAIDEKGLETFIQKYGDYTGTFNNAFDFGSELPELVAVNLIVSDGDPSRGNRELLLDPELNVCMTSEIVFSGIDSLFFILFFWINDIIFFSKIFPSSSLLI